MQLTKKRANDLGFSVYRANWYGGGFVGTILFFD